MFALKKILVVDESEIILRVLEMMLRSRCSQVLVSHDVDVALNHLANHPEIELVLAGVGPKTARLLAGRGLESVGALLFHLPSRYDDRRDPNRHRSFAMTRTVIRYGFFLPFLSHLSFRPEVPGVLPPPFRYPCFS